MRPKARCCGPQLCPPHRVSEISVYYSALGSSLARPSVGCLPIHGTGFYSDNLRATNVASDGFFFPYAASSFLTNSVYQYTGINEENFSGNLSIK